jgi:hypothetical protein
MRICSHHSLSHANKVLAIVKKLLNPISGYKSENLSLGVWSNCREQGYCISIYPNNLAGRVYHKLVFAEARSSDQVLVVTGENTDFDMQTNQPSEEAYMKNRKYFSADIEAAEYIVEFIKANVD